MAVVPLGRNITLPTRIKLNFVDMARRTPWRVLAIQVRRSMRIVKKVTSRLTDIWNGWRRIQCKPNNKNNPFHLGEIFFPRFSINPNTQIPRWDYWTLACRGPARRNFRKKFMKKIPIGDQKLPNHFIFLWIFFWDRMWNYKNPMGFLGFGDLGEQMARGHVFYPLCLSCLGWPTLYTSNQKEKILKWKKRVKK